MADDTQRTQISDYILTYRDAAKDDGGKKISTGLSMSDRPCWGKIKNEVSELSLAP